MAGQSSFFGRYQRFVTVAVLACYQLLIVPNGLLCLYALLTFNVTILTPLLCICFLQYPLGRSEKFIEFVQKYIQPETYFKKFSRLKQQEIPSDEKTLYGYHPHSIFSYTILLNMNRKDPGIPDFTGLGSRFGFNAPILGGILRLWGCSTVYNSNLRKLMEEGRNVGLVPGGYEEASLTTQKQMRLYLKRRKGFVKYALKYGYTMRPVISFGENRAFQTFDVFNSIRLFLNRFKIPAVFFINRRYLFFMDPNMEITTIVGRGIRKHDWKEVHEPSKQEVEQYHQRYVEQVERLYEKYKHLNQNKRLIIL